MAWRASADRLTFATGVVSATALGWVALASLADGYAAPLCGVSLGGLASLVALVAMWSLMIITMMLPVTLAVAPQQSLRDNSTFAFGYLATALIPAWGAALTEWTVRSLGTTPNTPGIQITLVAIAALGIVRDTRIHQPIASTGFSAGHAHLGACTAMVALQLAFGSMDLLLMATLALWMLAGAMTAGHRTGILRRT